MGKLLTEDMVRSQQGTVADRILDAVRGAPGCNLDDLDFSCPEFTWNQILLEIDRLNRMGRLEMVSLGKGVCTVRVPNNEQRSIGTSTGTESF